jgi:hypothetical protein
MNSQILKVSLTQNDAKAIIVQGMQYSMALAQPTKHFLTNEFQFALKASKYLKETSKLGSYFLIVISS